MKSSMKKSGKWLALTAALLTLCLMLAGCSSQREDIGVSDEKNMSITTAKDLEGKAVAVQLRSAADDYVVSQKLTEFPKRYENMEDAVQALMDKKVAVVLADSHYAKALIDGKEGVQIVKGSIGSVEYRFQMRKSAAVAVEDVNSQIAAMKATEDYSSMVAAELEKGETFAMIAKTEKSDKKLVLVAEPYFTPFAYESDGTLKGFFAAAAGMAADGCGAVLETRPVKAGEVSEAMAADENALCVVYQETDDEAFITTDPFYTSELVMIIRTPSKK